VVDLATVVVVDDAAEVRAVVRAQLGLSRRFAVVGEGGSGQDAIRLASEHRPDAILLDLRMPGVDGLAAIGGILAASPGTRVVVYTGIEDPAVAARALASARWRASRRAHH